jgi:phosphonate transport system substrate-binding protein
VSVVAWYILVKRQFAAGEQETRKQLLTAIGLNRPVTNGLDSNFTDADGDLVADAPKDAKDEVDPPTLMFCYVAAEEKGEEFKAAWSDFMKHLSDATGKPVEYLMLGSEREQLVALRDGKLHVTGLNTGRVPIAVDACGFVPVAMLADADGGGKTHTEIIVPSDSPAHNLSDLRGRELTLTDPGSNSGYKAPLVFLKDHGMLPERDFMMRFSGSHEDSIRGIASRPARYQAAAVAADVLHRAVGAGEIKEGQYRVLFKSEPFPTAGLGYAHNLKPELAKKVRDAMLDFKWAGTSTEKYYASSGQKGLVPVTYKDDWSIVRRIDDAIGYQHVVK